jgi:regulator of protease activity HflC (stomatin/prohibitin superfamily)
MTFRKFVISVLIVLAVLGIGWAFYNHPIVSAISLITFIFALIAIICISVWIGLPVHWYIALWMAKYDFVFTKVSEGHFKVVERFGKYKKTLLTKEGYKIDENGRIVELQPGETQPQMLPGGLHRIGWPGIDKIYSRQMRFVKSLQNGVEYKEVEDVTEFLAKVDYPYGIPFLECEDANNIPITGHATLVAHVDHPYNSLFAVANFYETMFGLSLPVARECFEEYSFTKLKESKKRQDLDNLLWEYLSDPNKNPQPGSNLSVIDELWQKYGVRVLALRVVMLDPPQDVRESSLKKWRAEMERDAAKIIAEKEAEETEGRVVEAVAKANGLSRKKLEEMLVENPTLKGKSASEGGFQEDFAHARDLLKRDRAGAGLEDIRVGNVDGTPLEAILGAFGAMFGMKQRRGKK